MRAAGKPERLSEQDVIALERLQSAGNQVFFRF
jgi:hypothetical protein